LGVRDVPATVKMLLFSTPQKFNTFNTFTTFAIFAIFNRALKNPILVHPQAPPARSVSEHAFSTPHPLSRLDGREDVVRAEITPASS
jgi:hypothetical protein